MLIIFCGIPGAGKSLIAQEVAKKLELNYKLPTLVVGTDSIRRMIPATFEKFNPAHEPFIRNTMKELVKIALKAGYVTICDDANYYASMRRDLIRITQKLKIPYKIVFIQCLKEVALKRNKERGEPIPSHVINNIARKFDTPGRYKWDKPSLIIESDKVNSKKAGALIVSNFAKKLLKRESGAICHVKKKLKMRPKITRIEKIDISTRKVMSKLIKQFKSKELAQILSKLRKNILQSALSKKMTLTQAEELFEKKGRELLEQFIKGKK